MGFLREPSHLLIVLLVVVVLFGGRRLPDAARSIGQAMRVFRSEVRQLADEPAVAAKPPGESTEPTDGRA